MPQIIPDPGDQAQYDSYNPSLTREQVADRITEIAECTKVELEAAGVSFPVFFLIPKSGSALITVGTTHDTSDEEWDTASAIAVRVVQEVLGVGKLHSNSIACALAHPVNNRTEASNAIV